MTEFRAHRSNVPWFPVMIFHVCDVSDAWTRTSNTSGYVLFPFGVTFGLMWCRTEGRGLGVFSLVLRNRKSSKCCELDCSTQIGSRVPGPRPQASVSGGD